jgi:hypothetical protein
MDRHWCVLRQKERSLPPFVLFERPSFVPLNICHCTRRVDLVVFRRRQLERDIRRGFSHAK